jgi:hypothetical protein
VSTAICQKVDHYVIEKDGDEGEHENPKAVKNCLLDITHIYIVEGIKIHIEGLLLQ